jgi:putative ABC transport system permease protein
MVLWRLAISNFLVRKVRTGLTVAAIALSVSLVVAVTSGYKSMEASALHFLNHYMGTSDANVMPADEMQGHLPESLVGMFRADPDVREVVGRLISYRGLKRAEDATRPDRSAQRVQAGALPADEINVQLVGVRRPEDSKIESIDLSSGQWFDGGTGKFAVIDQVAADKLGLEVGDEVLLPGFAKLSLEVVGIVHKPTFFAERLPTMYVPLSTLQEFTRQDNPPLVSRIIVNLNAGANYDAFQKRWTAKLAALDTNYRLLMRRDTAGELSKNLVGVHIVSYLGGCASMVTAMFIIFSALSMGVTERQRTLAMLRAIGAVRGQVFRLVLLEGLIIAIVGVIVGIAVGILCTDLFYLRFKEMFAAGPLYSYGGMAFAASGSILTALAASVVPAWTASRVSPMEAMTVQASGSSSGRPPLGWAMVGLVSIAIDPLLFYAPVEPILQSLGVTDPIGTARNVRFFGHFAVGLVGIMVGFFLLAPLMVWFIEKVFAVPVAAVLGLPGKLLRHQLSAGIWRAAGTAAALMVGLSTLIVMQVQGHTLIGGWRLPDKFPDIFIYSPDPIPWSDQHQLENVPGIASDSLMPVAMAAPTGDSKTALAMAAALAGRQGSMIFFGVDPERALKLIQLEYRDDDGNALPPDEQAAAAAKAAGELKKGRRIIVTDEFRQIKHLKVGDTLQLQTSVNGMQTYTICAIVWSPGADLIISLFDLDRLLDQQSAASVFGTLDDAKRDFGVTGARLFAANLNGDIDKDTLLKQVQRSMGDRGLRAGDVRQIKYSVERAFYRLLMLVSTVAFAAMAVASLGVTNTIMASVRSRRWQFGVLRSIGVARGQILRLVLAEAAMLGLVGVALGLAAGLEMAVDARKLSGVVMGYSPDLVIPWLVVGGGCGVVIGVALLASLWPAVSAARAEPLELLQAGRASM